MKYIVYIEQNGGEYTGWIKIECDKLTQLDTNRVMADNVVMEFDELIENIEEIKDVAHGKQD